MEILPYLICIVCCIVAQKTLACPENFVQLNGLCYNAFHLKATWSEAYFYCRQFNTELVTIENGQEQTYLANFLSRLSKAAFSPGEFWVGGSNLLTDTWMSSEIQPLTYVNWSPGQPVNNTQSHCIAMGFSSNFKWYNDVCNRKNNFICKSFE